MHCYRADRHTLIPSAASICLAFARQQSSFNGEFAPSSFSLWSMYLSRPGPERSVGFGTGMCDVTRKILHQSQEQASGLGKPEFMARKALMERTFHDSDPNQYVQANSPKEVQSFDEKQRKAKQSSWDWTPIPYAYEVSSINAEACPSRSRKTERLSFMRLSRLQKVQASVKKTGAMVSSFIAGQDQHLRVTS